MTLHNKTILITRPLDQSQEMCVEIERRGGHAVVVPMIAVIPPDSWLECDRALDRLMSFDTLLFTSRNGVQKFFERSFFHGFGLSELKQFTIVAVGKRTSEEIASRGLNVTFVPETFSGKALSDQIPAGVVGGKKILFPRGNLGGEELVADLRRRGAFVEPVAVYRTVAVESHEAVPLVDQLQRGVIDVATFASPSAFRGFARLLPMTLRDTLQPRVKIAVIGPATEAEVRRLGYLPDIVAREATGMGLVRSIDEYFA